MLLFLKVCLKLSLLRKKIENCFFSKKYLNLNFVTFNIFDFNCQFMFSGQTIHSLTKLENLYILLKNSIFKGFQITYELFHMRVMIFFK